MNVRNGRIKTTKYEMEVGLVDAMKLDMMLVHHYTDYHTACWVPKNGSPHIELDGRKVEMRRVSYALFRGDVPPKSYIISRVCRNGFCVNPDHLELTDYDGYLAFTGRGRKGVTK